MPPNPTTLRPGTHRAAWAGGSLKPVQEGCGMRHRLMLRVRRLGCVHKDGARFSKGTQTVRQFIMCSRHWGTANFDISVNVLSSRTVGLLQHELFGPKQTKLQLG